jgi:predicted pyridoxine 5'-phosphate oxidase superfamily flavin-nucleotide-binding protein
MPMFTLKAAAQLPKLIARAEAGEEIIIARGTKPELEKLYGQPVEAATVKEVDRITPHYRAYIEASPFAKLATSGPERLDCSPRGDRPGFARVVIASAVASAAR